MRERFDVLVLGSGIAGLSVALAARGLRVAVATPAAFGADGASAWAQGGIAAAIGAGDSAARHVADTLIAGAHHNDAVAVRGLAEGAPGAIAWLTELGVAFDRDTDGSLQLGREAAHSAARIVHAGGDATGAMVMRALTAAARAAPHIQVLERHRACDLLRADGRVVGAAFEAAAFTAGDGAGMPVTCEIRATRTVLATGGLGALYRDTTNPASACGDGLVLAMEAGAELTDLEFVQFHPTALSLAAGGSLPLVTEALRGAGAWLVNARGERFMSRHHARAELAPRDVVARAVYEQQQRGHAVFLDARRAVGAAFPQRFPSVFALCRGHGIDPRCELVPVTAAAHYHMGGVRVDTHGASSIPGLYAVGEVACSGVHGANRLASNSLLEGLVFGRALGERCAAMTAATQPAGLPAHDARLDLPLRDPPRRADQGHAATLREAAALRDLMSSALGVMRNGPDLVLAVSQFEALARSVPGSWTARRARLCARIADAALRRQTSLGAHARLDDPAESWATRRTAQA